MNDEVSKTNYTTLLFTERNNVLDFLLITLRILLRLTGQLQNEHFRKFSTLIDLRHIRY